MSEIKTYTIDEYLAREQPRAAIYAMLHGKWSLMSSKWPGVNFGPYKSTEEVYKACVEKGVTWQELLGYKPDNNITL